MYIRFALIFLAGLSAATAQAQVPPEAKPINPGQTIEREIAGGETHAYSLGLTAGQFMRVLVDPRGVDAVVRLVAPDGSQAGETDLTGIGGLESYAFLAEVGGKYQILVRAAAATAPRGTYQMRLDLRSTATAIDKNRIAGEHLLAEAFKLNQQGAATAESTLEKAQAGLALWREVADPYWEAVTLNLIGNASAASRKYDRALEYFVQALAIRREIKDRSGEGNTLANLGNVYRALNRYDTAIEQYDKALAIRRELKDLTGEAGTLANLGLVNFSLKRNEKAIEYYELSLAIYRDAKNRAGEAATLNSMSVAYSALDQRDMEIRTLGQALTIYRELKNRTAEAGMLSNLGQAYGGQKRYDKAIEYLDKALPIAREVKEWGLEDLALSNLTNAYRSLGQPEKMIEYYEQSLTSRRNAKYRRGEGNTLNNLGNVYASLQRDEKAIEYYEQAVSIHREVKNRVSEANTLFNLGDAYSKLKRYENAADNLEKSVQIRHELKDPAGEGRTLNKLGNTYDYLGQYDKAVKCLEQALEIYRALKDRAGEMGPLNNLGNAYSGLSKFDIAIKYYEQALALSREVKHRVNEAGALTNLANVYEKLSRYDRAIEYFEQALAISRELKDRSGEGIGLHDLGITFYKLARYEKSIESLEHALSIYREVKSQEGEWKVIVHLGTVYRLLGQYEMAIDHYEKGLDASRGMNSRVGEGETLNGLGIANIRLNRLQKGLECYERALAIFREIKDRANEADVLDNLGEFYRLLKDPKRAIAYHDQVVGLAHSIKLRGEEASALNNLMLDWKELKRPGVAAFFGKQSVNLYQEIRGDIRSLDLESKQSFLRSKEDTYRTLAELLMALGRLPEAEHVINMLKEEEYFDYIRRDVASAPQASRAEFTSEESDLEKRYREIADQLATIGAERGLLVDRKNRTPEEEKRLAKLDADLVVAGAAFQKFLDVLAADLKGSRDTSGRVNQMRDSQGLMEDLRELGKGVVALYTLVGDDKYRIILTTPDFQKGYEYPIKAIDLNRKVLEFRRVIQNPKLDPVPLARELYKILVGPVAKDLKAAKAETLMWSLDGVLRYVPIAALHDGNDYLVKSYRNVVFTAVSQARLKDMPTRQWTALGLGVTKSHGPGITALPGVVEEMRGIIRESGAEGQSGVMPGTIKLDEAFTQESMLAGLRLRPPVVHVASHFQFSPGNETQSALLLGDGSLLSLAEIKMLPNVFGGVELLTLSACNTATGGSGANGREVEGFGVLAQRQGAKAVVASLWSVADRSTKVLMQDFYRLREARVDTTKAEALRQSQLRLLRGETMGDQDKPAATADRQLVHEGDAVVTGPPFTPDPKKPYAHPYYWAPFILIGNWK